MKHLSRGATTWCPVRRGDKYESTTNPRDATCTSCLRSAAEYGAACAVQCAVVDAEAHENPELVQERDEAIRRCNLMSKLLEEQGVFVCVDCQEMKRVVDRAQRVGTMSWCTRCAPSDPRQLA